MTMAPIYEIDLKNTFIENKQTNKHLLSCVTVHMEPTMADNFLSKKTWQRGASTSEPKLCFWHGWVNGLGHR